MRFFTTALVLLAGTGLSVVRAQDRSSVDQIPTCANSCAQTAAGSAKCSLSDASAPCLCFSNFRNDVVKCSMSACTIEDRGSVQGVMDTFCNGVSPVSGNASSASSTSGSSSSSAASASKSSSSSSSKPGAPSSTHPTTTRAPSTTNQGTTTTAANTATATGSTTIASAMTTSFLSTLGTDGVTGSVTTDGGDSSAPSAPASGAGKVGLGMGGLIIVVVGVQVLAGIF